jgi:hypothetical protein
MAQKLLIAAGEAAAKTEDIPQSVQSLIDAAEEILVIAPSLPGRFEWLVSATDKAREQADERLHTILGQLDEMGADAVGTVGADDPPDCVRGCHTAIRPGSSSDRDPNGRPRRLAREGPARSTRRAVHYSYDRFPTLAGLGARDKGPRPPSGLAYSNPAPGGRSLSRRAAAGGAL